MMRFFIKLRLNKQLAEFEKSVTIFIKEIEKSKSMSNVEIEKKVYKKSGLVHFISKFTKEKDETKLILLSCHPYPKNTDRILIYSKLAEVRELQ